MAAGKLQIREVPDPFGPISDDDFLLRAAPAAIPGFQIDAFAELAGGFDRAGISGGVRIADGVAVPIPGGLSEDATQLDFTRVGGLAIDFAGPSLGFFFDHRDSGSIRLYVQDGNRFSHYHGEIQLHGTVHFLLPTPGHICADALRRSLYGFGGDFQTGQ